MNHWFLLTKRWSLAIASAATLAIGAMALLSCGGEGGPVGSGGGGGGGGNSFTAQFMALLPAGQAGATYVGPDTCKTCHNGAGTGAPKGRIVAGEPIYDEWHETMHFSKNVTCENCHGPGSIHAAAPATDNILTSPKLNNPIVCAQCHGPLYDQYKQTPHAEVLEDPVQSAINSPSGARSSRCIQCHSGLFRTETAESGIDVGTMTDQQIIDLGHETLDDVPFTAACSTCHNPHKKTGPDNLTWEGEERQLRHKTLNLDTTQVNYPATAATFVNFDQICAQCHNGRAPNTSDAGLTSSTSRPPGHHNNQYNMLMGVGGVEGSGTVQRNMAHATAPGQCTHCHMPDSNHSYTPSYDGSCQPCHTAEGAAANANSVKTTIINAEYALLTRLRAWSQTTFADPDLWDFTTNITAKGKVAPSQTLVPIQVKRARANYWYILIDNSMGPHNFPYMTTLIQVANDNLTALGVPPGAPNPGRATDLTTNQKLQVLKAERKVLAEADKLPD